MPGIRIGDLEDRGGLAFDLADLLGALGEPVRSSRWKCSVERCLSREGARPRLEDAYNAPDGIGGRDLLALAAETLQVIDGVFDAFLPGAEAPWIRLETIDSSYWEVTASDPVHLAPFEARFRKVERLGP